mgnify:CR=1 FL=1
MSSEWDGATEGIPDFGCDNCNHKLYEVRFPLNDIEKDFLKHFKHFYNSKELRTCDNCGTVMPIDERYVADED